jgi:starch-binding outer membrane protein, SusD/RagB family
MAGDVQPRLLSLTLNRDTGDYMMTTRRTVRRSARGASRAALAAVMLTSLAACELDKFLEVDAPSRIPADQLETPGNAVLLVNSAIADFECAYGAYVVAGGLIGEELADGIQTADRYPYDRRSVAPIDLRYSTFSCTAIGMYTPLQTARVQAENVLGLLQTWTDEEVPNRQQLIATAAAHAGWSLLLLGEGFCSMVVSSIDANRQVVYGSEVSREEVFALAEERLTQAIDGSTDVSITNMALLGRAKARQNLGRLAEASADAAQVPADFVRNVTASATSGRRQNRVFSESSPTSTSSVVADPYSSITDPRIPLGRHTPPRNTVTGIPVVYQTKYDDAADPIPFATGDEAQLIIAEAELAAGNLTAANTIINTFRTRAGQGAFNGTTAAEVRAELIEQRRRELFLEGQHLGDLIRYGITPSPAVGSAYHGSGTYGNQLCMPLPDVEVRNNPNTG